MQKYNFPRIYASIFVNKLAICTKYVKFSTYLFAYIVKKQYLCARFLICYKMHNYLTSLLVGLLIFLCPSLTHAERIYTEHKFNTMVINSEIVVTNSFHTAETDLLTYQCSGTNASFAKDHLGANQWSFKLLDNGSTVTTTRIPELAEMSIAHYPASKYEALKVYISTDSIAWSLAPATYSAGTINVTIPRNNYYVRFKNTASTDVSILSIIYYQDHCNCFIYEP